MKVETLTAMKVETLTLGLFASALAGATEAADAPTQLIWLTAACAGTLMGAAASAFAFANIDAKQRIVRLLVSFCAGLLIAPYAAEYIPRPDAVPLVAHVFAASGLSAFVAWSLVRAAQKRMNGIADGLIDRVAGKRKREKDEHEYGGP